MYIHIDESSRVFTLNTKHTSYQLRITPDGFVHHVYYGPPIGNFPMAYSEFTAQFGFSPNPISHHEKRDYSVNDAAPEYPGCGCGDFRVGTICVENADGSLCAQFLYHGYEVTDGKYEISGLPSACGAEQDCQTLRIDLLDPVTDLSVSLYYGIFYEADVITRYARLQNRAAQACTLRKAASACLDIPFGDWELIHFHGRHCMERQVQRLPVSNTVQVVQSTRGASSHQHNPFVILAEPETGETAGACFGAMLVYSGSYKIELERDQRQSTRLVLGIQNDTFSWELQPGEIFSTPEVLFSYSDKGLETLSHQYHRFLRRHICRGEYRDIRRPILINSWEAVYFHFDGEKLLGLARQAAELGVELFVMDDGWFGIRDNDHSGLGDWTSNEEKLGCTFEKLIGSIRALGLQFGLWIEPEMVSMDSELYRTHPDWALQAPGRAPAFSRSQLVLDLSRADVRAYLYDCIATLLSRYDISYIKWDMNRHLSDVFGRYLPAGRQGELPHCYVLGVYELLDRLTKAFPSVLFESCSGGGGRFDAGMLCYTPQIWCSDNTDPIARLKIQYGTSFGYPVSTVGSHVSVSPNHQTGRTTPIETRSTVAMSGTFGYELNLYLLSDAERAAIPAQIENYKKYWALISHGNYYRLTNAMRDTFFTAWQFASEDRSEALLNVVVLSPESTACPIHLRLRGLDPDALYTLEGIGTVFSGAALMYGGYTLPRMRRDYPSVQLHFQKMEKVYEGQRESL